MSWIKGFGAAAGIAAAGLWSYVAEAQEKPKDPPSIAFIYIGPISDGGWVGAQERARVILQNEFKTKIPYVENVPEITERVRQSIDLFISRGANIVVGDAYGFSDAFLAAAKDHPEVAFLNMGGVTKASPNYESFYARTYEGWYLAGMAAGSVTKGNVLGMLQGFPVPNVVWDVNAFALGAKSVNPNAVVKVAYVNSWDDPVKEGQLAKALIDQGADVIGTDMDSGAALVAAEKAGKFSVGFHDDMSAIAPNGFLTSVVFHWEKKLVPMVAAMKAGTWQSNGLALYGIKDGATDIVKPSHISADMAAKIDAARSDIISGKLAPFDGPVTAQDGSVKIPQGGHITDDQLWTMDYLVSNVQGSMK